MCAAVMRFGGLPLGYGLSEQTVSIVKASSVKAQTLKVRDS